MKLSVVILAAGQGTRMKSSTPKVLHKLANIPMLEHILKTVTNLNVSEIRVVASEEMLENQIFKSLEKKYKFSTHIQFERKGTAHALMSALDTKLKYPALVICGDTPLIKLDTIEAMYEKYNELKADILCLGFKAENPKGYGRLVTFDDNLVNIVEELDASDDQRKIDKCNSGIYIFDNKHLPNYLKRINTNNKKGELYLTDVISIANNDAQKCIVHLTDEDEVLGINDKLNLAKAESIIQKNLRNKFLVDGVTIIDPQSVYLSADTKIGRDVTIHPNVIIGENVVIDDCVEILAFSHIVGAKIGSGTSIGPFARLRPNTKLGKNCKVGNFVEMKAVEFSDHVKASHLSYIGDAKIGKSTNIGAGTIFCNYDGSAKHFSDIGADVFLGSNTSIVAPIAIGDRAIIGAGSVITENVEHDALSIARARQVNFQQKAQLIRKKKKIS